MAPEANDGPIDGFDPDAPAPPAPTPDAPKSKKASGKKRTVKMGGVTVDISVAIAKGKGAPGFSAGSQAIETICRKVTDDLRVAINEALGG